MNSKTDELNKEYEKRVEAVLFASGKSIDEKTLSELCEIDIKKLRKVLESLKSDYDKRDCALAIFEENKSWKINVKEKYLHLVRKIVSEAEMPKSVMETLAVIAWKNPIYQSEVVKIRGNKCYEHIANLEELDFVVKQKKGRSFVIKLTEKFFNYFDIDNKNLQGILEEIKSVAKEVPEQTTLIDPINPQKEEVLTTDDAIKKIESLEIKRKVEDPLIDESHKNFLSEISNKIDESAKRTSEIEIVKNTHEDEKIELSQNPELKEESNETTQDNTESKPKKFTKKQLEKKFREDIIKTRDKITSNKKNDN